MFDSASRIFVAFQFTCQHEGTTLVGSRSQKTHDFEMLRLSPDFKMLRLAGVWLASGWRLTGVWWASGAML